PAFVTVFLAALISGCMHGVNHMLISLIPKNFSKYGMVSTLSGLLNAFTYVGASLSTYGFAAIADNIGWSAVRLIWSIIAFMGTLVCVLKIKSWNRILKS
ncbi:MAG: MFS transporter, partial [Clostridia bacterium]|nr:MFS transporter [Clostridia bacterium]